jgi:hypothetical protein
MKTIDVIANLRAQGYSVEYWKRPDGGVRITSINGLTYSMTGGKGNAAAREILGQGLSTSQRAQRQAASLRTLEGHSTADLPKLTASERKWLRKMNYKYKKIAGKRIGMHQARRNKFYNHSSREMKRAITNTIKHSLHIAYRANVEWTIAMLENTSSSKEAYRDVINYLKRHINQIQDESLHSVHQLLYAAQAEDNCAEAMLQILKEGTALVKESLSLFK